MKKIISLLSVIFYFNSNAQVVTTLAGSYTLQGHADGTGPAASFNYPSAITTDGNGNLFTGDMTNNEIRMIIISTGMVTTLAGSPSRGLRME